MILLGSRFPARGHFVIGLLDHWPSRQATRPWIQVELGSARDETRTFYPVALLRCEPRFQLPLAYNLTSHLGTSFIGG